MANSIQSISLEKLIAHPANANRMSKANFDKLAAHIKRTGRYEPIVVRPLVEKDRPQSSLSLGLLTERTQRENELENNSASFASSAVKFQILNGHHRVNALRQLGYCEADCVCWAVDDTEADILLATLNRLVGRDDVHKRSELIKQLSQRFSIKEMTRLLPDGKKQLQRLKDLVKPVVAEPTKCFANAVVFFLTDEQKAIVDKALKLARQIRERREECKKELVSAKKRACGLVTIAQQFLEKKITAEVAVLGTPYGENAERK